MGVAQFLVIKFGRNVVIKYIFAHFFIFAKMGSQKGAKNLFIDFFQFCVDRWLRRWPRKDGNERQLNSAHFETHMGFQNSV